MKDSILQLSQTNLRCSMQVLRQVLRDAAALRDNAVLRIVIMITPWIDHLRTCSPARLDKGIEVRTILYSLVTLGLNNFAVSGT